MKKPEVSNEYASVACYARRFANSMREIETLIVSYDADRAKYKAIVERYAYDSGKKYEKAQKAAVKFDNASAQLSILMKRRETILRSFHKVWGLYTRNEKAGKIIADYLRYYGDELKLRKKYSGRDVDVALALWWQYCDTTAMLAIQRNKEAIARHKRLANAIFAKKKEGTDDGQDGD